MRFLYVVLQGVVVEKCLVSKGIRLHWGFYFLAEESVLLCSFKKLRSSVKDFRVDAFELNSFEEILRRFVRVQPLVFLLFARLSFLKVLEEVVSLKLTLRLLTSNFELRDLGTEEVRDWF